MCAIHFPWAFLWPHKTLRMVLSGALLILATHPAWSGAYLENTGMGLLMMNIRFDQARVALSSSGSPAKTVVFKRIDEVNSLELGLNDRVTFLLNAGATKSTYQDATQYSYYTGRSITEVGARLKLVRGADWMVSAQATELLPINTCSCISAVASDTLEQQDVRLLAGKNFKIGTRYPLYAEIQIGERFRQSASTEMHIDTSLAWRPSGNLMLLGQTFTSQAAASGTLPAVSQTKGQISFIYDISKSLAFQFGLFKTLAARNALSEHGVITGLWLHF